MTSTLIRPQDSDNPKYRAITLHNIANLPQAERLTKEQRFAIDVVSRVLPFKTNNYVVDELINWDDVPNDPIFTLTFPQQDMLSGEHFEEMASLVSKEASRPEIEEAANRIRMTLNPHPGGTARAQRSRALRRERRGATAQVRGNGPPLPQQRADVPRVLHVLLPLAAVRRHRRPEVRDEAGRGAYSLSARAAARERRAHHGAATRW